MGQTLTLKTQGSSLPGELTALMLVDVSGTPLLLFIAYIPLDGTGGWEISTTVPSGLDGQSLTFQSYALKPPGVLVASNPEEIFFQ